ncbi:hypothetical protein MTR_3g040310 [Medicago truncatula]|uniref:Uncharacterized protein n=1 Tax=Medicago truncatula TaxID=3880 RepID=A0A072UWQ3_MEDTR|nr:hypothetical protein MTR_3g040310 [Medicago truncatula]
MWYQPGHQALNIKSINTLTGHQALNIRAKAHRASSPQLQMSMHGLNNLQLGQLQQLIQTKATGKLTQKSTTFMFTPKANSKQKRVKKMQEHETERAVREQLGKNPFFTPKSQF